MYEYLISKAELYIIEFDTPDGWLPIGDVALLHDCGVLIVIGNPEYRSKGIGKRADSLYNRAKELGRKKSKQTECIYLMNDPDVFLRASVLS